MSRQVARVLTRGLTDRIALLRVQALPAKKYALDQAPGEADRQVVLGIMLDTANSQRLVDMGPPADDVAKVPLFFSKTFRDVNLSVFFLPLTQGCRVPQVLGSQV